MSWASRLSFCGLTRSIRATAFASFSARLRGWDFLLMSNNPRSCRRRACARRRTGGSRTRARAGRALDLAVGRMAMEGPRWGKFAELVPDHLLGDHHRDVLVAVVDSEGQADELRQDRRAPAPGLDHVVPTRRTRGFRLLQQIAVDERAFPH